MALTTITPNALWGSWNADEHTVQVEPVREQSLRGVRSVFAVHLDGKVIGYVLSQVNGRRTDWDSATTANAWNTERLVYGLTNRPMAINQAVENALRG